MKLTRFFSGVLAFIVVEALVTRLYALDGGILLPLIYRLLNATWSSAW